MWARELVAMPAREARPYVAAVEALGYGAIWIPETVGGKEILAHASVVLSSSHHIVVAAGVANVWARDPMAAMSGARVLEDAFPGRFILGLGISHAPNASLRGHAYHDPVRTMRAYLDRMDAEGFSVPGVATPPRMLAALGPRMLALSAERVQGAHPYLVTPSYTRDARRLMGPRAILAVEQSAVFTGDPEEARRAAREHLQRYLDLDNFRRNLRRMGWSDRELSSGGSDAVVDALVAWGTPEQIGTRMKEHLDAGADHVAVQVLGRMSIATRLTYLRSLTQALRVSGSRTI